MSRWKRLVSAAGMMLTVIGGALATLFAIALIAVLAFSGRASGPVPDLTEADDAAGIVGQSVDDPVDWERWHDVNPEVIGWLAIPGTGVNHPVAKAPDDDPTFYLTHDSTRSWNPLGCPYLDAGCAEGLDSPNAVIVGHNISFPPSMFHDIEGYHDAAYAAEHREAYLFSPDGTCTLRVIGVRTIRGTEECKRVSFEDEQDFGLYRADLLSGCDFTFDDPHAGSRIVTLCTCSYFENPADERTLVIMSRACGDAEAGQEC